MSLKLRTFGFLFLIWCAAVQAQDCIPDQSIKDIGFSPKVIDDAYVGKPYKQVLQIRVFKDTVVLVAGNPTLATIDSIKVLDIMGLPKGFYYTCSRKNCSFIPDSTGCATLKGNPTASDVGTYPLLIAIEVYAKIFGTISSTQKDTLDQFNVNVIDESGAQIYVLPNTNVCYPNPSSTGQFKFNKAYSQHIQYVNVVNMLGQEVLRTNSSEGFKLEGERGLYYVEIQFSNGLKTNEKILFLD